MPETPDVRWLVGESQCPLSSEAVKEVALCRHWPAGREALFRCRMSHTGILAKLDSMTLDQGIEWIGRQANEAVEILAGLDVRSAVKYLRNHWNAEITEVQ